MLVDGRTPLEDIEALRQIPDEELPSGSSDDHGFGEP